MPELNTRKGAARHPEKQKNPDRPQPRRPEWLRVKAPVSKAYNETRKLMRAHNLVTVCEEAACPNIGECWSQKHATMMILGSVCTRACAFCNVATGRPDLLDPHEPENVGKAVATLGLKHVVITSVDRDDLDDGGAQHFAQTISAIRAQSPDTTIEVLTPDFLRKDGAVEIVVAARPDVFNHNMETVRRLTPEVRSRATYDRSLAVLNMVKQRADYQVFTKSGLMLGLGETEAELEQTMHDLREANCDILTLGQYLQPTVKHLSVKEYVHPDTFDRYGKMAESLGFIHVASGPMVRSSYHADAFNAKDESAAKPSLP